MCDEASDFQRSLDSYLGAMESYLDHVKAYKARSSDAEPKVIWLAMSKIDEAQVWRCLRVL